METLHGKTDGPFVVDRDLALHGMVTVSASVKDGCTFIVHGMVTGDLLVEPGGRAVIHGMVNGAVINHGYVEIHGWVDEVFDRERDAQTILMPSARIRGRM